jgi:putative hemolysin
LDPSLLLDILLLVVFLGLSALFFAAEFAFFSVSEDDLDKRNGRRSDLALRMLSKPHELLTKLLIASSICSVLCALFGLRITWRAFPAGSARVFASIVCLLVVSVLIATVARLVPRLYVARNPAVAVYNLARPIFILFLPIYPIMKVVFLLTRGLFLAGSHAREMLLKSGQLRAMARAGEGSESSGQDEQEMINAIFEMRDTTVREVMVPRIDMVCAEATTTVGEAINVIAEGGHSRIPVYNKTIDDIRGILHARDLFKFVREGGLDAGIGEILRDAYFVPESKKVRELLKELRRRKTHMAVVVDEFGGIYDEYEDELTLVQVVGNDEVRVDGKVRIDELNDTIGTAITKEEDFDTIAGYLYNNFGKVPSEGDVYEADGLRFLIEKVTGQRIERVLIGGEGVGRSAREAAEQS